MPVNTETICSYFMRKFAIFSGIIFISIVAAGLYGIIHDQITYSISPEYFTKFKYRQFGFEPAWFGGDRPTVAVIGFLATWWTGLFIGFGLGLTALIFNDHKAMRAAANRAIFIVMAIAMISGFAGFLYGKFVLADAGVDWWLPNDLQNKAAFITVGSIHNFSYLGGLLGLVVGIVYLLRRKYLQRIALGTR